MKRILSFVLVLLIPLVLPSVAPARPRGSGFVFHGSGNGHGIGMSQYGALGLARQGWSAGQIVKHYYRGVKVVRRSSPAGAIRVGLLQHAASARLIASSGGYDLVLEDGTAVDHVPEGSRRTIEVTADRRYRVTSPGGELGTFGGAGNDLLARYGAGRVRVVEWGHEVGRGELRFDISGNGRAHLLAVMPVEDYLLGIAEVPTSWPKEALGAQAIAARTYAYWRLAGGERAGCGCDVFSTTADQNYTGWDKEAAEGANRWSSAVAETAQTVLIHDGAFIYAAYSSASGGYTEDIENVWPGAQPLPYLRGVCDPGDAVEDNPNRFWSVSFGRSQLTSDLRSVTGNVGEVRRFANYQRGVSGRVTSVRVVGASGSKVVRGWDIRSALSLRDTRFSVNRNLNITGDIRGAYDRMRCRPGPAASPQKKAKGGGRWQAFAKGRMYEHNRRGKVTWLRGRLLREYLKRRGPKGRLGLPIKGKGARRAWFDGGSITCKRGCRVRFR